MVWYFIGVYIINRTLHGRLEIQNFSSRVEKILLEEKFHISMQPCNILYECRNVSTSAQESVATNCCLGQHGCSFWKKLKCWFLLILLNFTIHCTNGDFYVHSCHGNHKSVVESKLQDCGNLSNILDHNLHYLVCHYMKFSL